MTVKTKLRLAFLLMIVLFGLFGAVALKALSLVGHDIEHIAGDVLPSVVASNAINTATSDYRDYELLHILSIDPAERREYETQLAKLKDDIALWRSRYEPLVDTPEEKARYANFSRDYATYLAGSARLLEASAKGAGGEALGMVKEANRLFGAFSDDLVELVRLAQADSERTSQDAARVVSRGRTVIIVGLTIGIGFALFCMWLVETMIARPVAGLTGTLRQVGSGDLSVEVGQTDRADDIGQMARATEATIVAVKGLAGDVGTLVDAAQSGALSVRAERGQHQGEYAVLVGGLNELIETLTRPLFEVVSVMQLLSAGDLQGRMTGSYEGDLRALKANMNRSLDGLVNLLGELADLAGRMAGGDLTGAVAGSYQGDFAVLKGNVNRALEQMRGLIGHIADDTVQIAAAATETSAAARQVAELSDRQLMSLTAVAGAVGQTAQSVEEIAANAGRGRDLATATAGLAEEGRVKLAHLSGAVERIAAAHDKIERIAGTITRIADKTHILSLNAGIEAARAGEQGLGFGIVAQQIGRLAEDAALAVRDIESIVAESAQTVREGVATAGEARGSIERIAEAARDSGGAVQAISAAMAQQSVAVQELVRQLGELRAGSEGNAAAAEEISATMEELARMVHRARDQVGRFRLA
ncbi:methyl-accepting chemotaxis protein [Azospirillum agricola]|uniref:HAMP domain-containing methyl-accepting chemotaxis protein n=1 Tax=Azospirillum agricola TaxID=1720247 RepID=UPI001AE84117|nr:methyl-accepting chemotaxis protein [Azospirillum agricola]MBP2231167.1 methyl-accepting chemotaxis protein [Azospirillum agricola]